MRPSAFVLLSVVALLAGAAHAAPSITVGTHVLRPEWAGQIIELHVTGGDEVQGLELIAQIGDATAGPQFQDANILDGTIFDGNNPGLFGGSYVDPRQLYLGVVTTSGTVAADGLLATLTLDTHGAAEGQYALSLASSIEGATNFAGIAADLIDGWIIVPHTGDTDGDGDVDLVDFGALAGSYDTSGHDPATSWPNGDFDGDGDVDLVDFGTLAGEYGYGTAPLPTSLPGPTTAGVLCAAVPLLLNRRRPAPRPTT